MPGLGVYAEVKPSLLIPYQDLSKLVEFAHAGENKLLLVAGSPGQETMYLIDRSTCGPLPRAQEGSEGAAEAVITFLESLERCGTVRLCLSPLTRRWMVRYTAATPYDEGMERRAIEAARSARF